MFSLSAYLFQQQAVILATLPVADTTRRLTFEHLTTWAYQLMEWGYTPSLSFLTALRETDAETAQLVQAQTLTLVSDLVGASRQRVDSFYPNFPQEVMTTPDALLFWNSLCHYLTEGVWRPQGKREVTPLVEEGGTLKSIRYEEPAYLLTLFSLKCASAVPLRSDDCLFLGEMMKTYRMEELAPFIPTKIPQRETMAWLASYAMEQQCLEAVYPWIQTPNDVLRLCCVLSEGDASLTYPTRFKSFSRGQRRFLLALLEKSRRLEEELTQRREVWLRLGERLHPAEYGARYPKTAKAFVRLRQGQKIETFASRVEAAFAQKRLTEAVALLQKRPGDFARRLDQLLRLASYETEENTLEVLESFEKIVPLLTPVMCWQLISHFAKRDRLATCRTFVPKGQLTKLYGTSDVLPTLPTEVTTRVQSLCLAALHQTYAQLDPLETVYLDPCFQQYALPFSMRNAQVGSAVVGRGSRFPVSETAQVLRLFVHWQNNQQTQERADVDLSVLCYNKQGELIDRISFYHLGNEKTGLVHSGDFVDAPEGAAEYVDIPLSYAEEKDMAHVLVHLETYSGGPFDTLEYCQVGWMIRQSPQSGEVFEPKTVEHQLSVNAKTMYYIPFVWDIQAREVIWADMSVPFLFSGGTADSTSELSRYVLQHLLHHQAPTLHELISLHVEARGGQLVETEEEATQVFGGETGLSPTNLTEILAHYVG